jgi:hypothetical protein
MEETPKEWKFDCYDKPMSHLVRIIGSFAISFFYRYSYSYDGFVKVPDKTVIVDNDLKVVGNKISLVEDDEELWSYLVYIYNNLDRFDELFCIKKEDYMVDEEDIEETQNGIMAQIVSILNERFYGK